ncbi:hypothetical protein TCAL_03013 [Tigriopus californicus]|uniref:Uncharacterized protein n=1 Tax=Tigriopus californicus TaxID=6832 RepID=A0A553NS83_TIGCA|nr:hypothetical protein TCAL_03013 [Tigriopus californicus]
MDKKQSFLQELQTVFDRKHMGENDPIFETPSRSGSKPELEPHPNPTSAFPQPSLGVSSSLDVNSSDSLRSLTLSLQSEQDQYLIQKSARNELEHKLAEADLLLRKAKEKQAQMNEPRPPSETPKAQKCESIHKNFWQERTALLIQSDQTRKELEKLRQGFEASRIRQQTLHTQRMAKIQSEIDEKIHVLQQQIEKQQNVRKEKSQRLASLQEQRCQLESQSSRDIKNIQLEIQQRHEKTKQKIGHLKEEHDKKLSLVEEPTAILEMEARSLERELKFLENEITFQESLQVAKDRDFEDRMANVKHWSTTQAQMWQEQHQCMTMEVTQLQAEAKVAQEQFHKDLNNQQVERQHHLNITRDELVNVLQQQTELRLKVADLEQCVASHRMNGAKAISNSKIECQTEIKAIKGKKMETDNKLKRLQSAIRSATDDPEVHIPRSGLSEPPHSPGGDLSSKLEAIASLKDRIMISSKEYLFKKQGIQSQVWHDITKLVYCIGHCENQDSSTLDTSRTPDDTSGRFLEEINTPLTDIEECLKKFIKRDDVDIILINQNIAEMIRHTIDQHTAPVPAILEIPSKDHPYDPSKDSILRRAKGMFSIEDMR